MQTVKNLLLLCVVAYQSWCFADVTQHFNRIKTDPNALYAFFKSMPKGGELHYHLAGGAYPETMLAVAAKNNYCLDKKSFSIINSGGQCTGLEATSLGTQPDLYNAVVRAWSMKDFIPGAESGHDHFFASFYKFITLFAHHEPEFLAEVMQRAAEQKEQYMEIMIMPDNLQSIQFAPKNFSLDQMAKEKEQLLANPAFQKTIKETISKADDLLVKTRDLLDCKQNPEKPACKITVGFQYYILREQPLEKVFAQALNGFAAASASQTILGVNLVQAEDGFISLRDYQQQMKIFEFLHAAYPKVHIDLHAGELAPQLVKPENTRFHIHDAIITGHAERIGHGVDISQENDAEALLQLMKERQIPVEINLISNQKILNISGKQHPLHYYLNHNVPVVLSTDDEGVLRTDLTAQYVEAALGQGLDYPVLKQINRNALTFSFLPGKSLWANAEKGLAVDACQDLKSSSCLQYVKNNPKAALQRELEIALTAFEKSFE